MPEKEGVETIREIKEQSPNMRIIAMSGGGSTGEFLYLKFAEDLGADKILKKPFDKQELLANIESLI